MSLKQLDQSQMPVSTADLAPNVPQELIIDVLLRLPAKSVGKFRCVSKSWRSLLSDSVFIKVHLDLHLHHPQKFILSSSEYGVQESGTKYRPNTHPDTCLSLPVCLLGDDDLVLHVHQSLHKLVVHSLTGETKRDMLVTGIGNAFRDVKGICESLV